MLYQRDLLTGPVDLSGLYSDPAVKVHGYVMSKIPPELADKFHDGGLQPFSIFTVPAGEGMAVRLSALNEDALPVLDAASAASRIEIYGMPGGLAINSVIPYSEADLNDIVATFRYNHIKMSFVTPATYKSGGALRHSPELASYFESVLLKLSKFEGIQIAKEDFREAFREVRICDYSLFSEGFLTGSRVQRGMKGFAEAVIPSSGYASEIIRTALAYATYSGVGGQTTQGMGGFVLERARKNGPRR